MNKDQQKKTAFVTGSTRGIGRELVKQLCAHDVTVFATGRNADALESLKKETGCLGETCDVADATACLKLYQSAEKALGDTPDFLVNNAGFTTGKDFIADTKTEDFDLQFVVNLRAPYIFAREALKGMQKRQSGHIVNIVSTSALFANEKAGIYSTMKWGLRGLTEILIKEARPHKVKVSGIYPGGIDSDFREIERPDYMRPESVAALIVQVLFSPADVVVHQYTFRPFVENNF